jgi:hypothetical protein
MLGPRASRERCRRSGAYESASRAQNADARNPHQQRGFSHSVEHGESGGPFFAWWPNNDPRIVGVVAAGGSFGDDRDNALGGGPNLVDLVDWARANWPA